ncbi:N(2)-fixation sustaining protein CowN [Celerinatantimonas sp. MCCC 1A17872]|uniref:N(2)-fixation sustaining protein CowN n=1 Tax=Celerinatantimonas sp. MCCC 1A17872 TaxID=3177514 RepID=UPI0038BF7E7C
MNEPQLDRYQSFCGIECDKKADELVGRLKSQLNELEPNHPWRSYFEQKFEEQAKHHQDNLYYVGSQVNALYSYFEEMDDDEGTELLSVIEEQCC